MSSFQENTVTGVTEKHTLSDVFNQQKNEFIKNSKCIINVSSKSFSIQSTKFDSTKTNETTLQ